MHRCDTWGKQELTLDKKGHVSKPDEFVAAVGEKIKLATNNRRRACEFFIVVIVLGSSIV